MKLKGKLLKLGVFCSVVLLCALLVTAFLMARPDHGNGTFMLARPAFAQAAEASFLDQEAGIAAYVNVGQTIDLTKAKAAYRTVEKETASYIVGSVALPDYPVSEDVHAFVHKDGWIVVYYLKDEPTSKIVDWKGYSAQRISTKLELGLAKVGNTLGVAITNQYYHFHYPAANKLMIVAKAAQGTFKIKLPSSFNFYERSYLYWGKSYAQSSFDIDGKRIRDGEGVWYDLLSPSQLSPDVFHTINIDRYGGLGAIVLVYRES